MYHNIKRMSQNFTMLHRYGHTEQFWNYVKGVKRGNTNTEDITLSSLCDHFSSKLSGDGSLC